MNIFRRYVLYLKGVWGSPSAGFGDTVAKITKSFGISPCPACERRRKKFNEMVAYRKKMDKGVGK